MTDQAGNDWKLEIRPGRIAPLIEVLLVWLACMPLILWGLLGEPGIGFALICSGFPLVITYYGLRSAFSGSGVITIDEQGFEVVRPSSRPERFSWSDIDAFFVGAFGASPFYAGKPVPHFFVREGKGGRREVWLPSNTGLSAETLTGAMEFLRLQALAGWPQRPGDLRELVEASSSVGRSTGA